MLKRKLRERMEGRERRGGNVDEAIQAIVRGLKDEDEACEIGLSVSENATYYILLNLVI